MARFRAGVDIGGTFTDVVFLGEDGAVLVRKVASTPDDYGRAVLQGLAEGMSELRIGPEEIPEVSHGFTVATNAILERKGEPTALITTAGFRDVLELTRIRTPRLYDLYYQKPPALVERRLRFEVRERVSFRGEVLLPLEMSDVEAVAERIAEEGIRSVAISLLHSYANPDHEERIAETLRSRLPGVDLSVSSDVLPEMREYERTSTTVINAYVRPVVAKYLSQLGDDLQGMGISVPLTVMQSNGGLTPVRAATEKPIFCIESGPAAGVVGAYHLGKRLGLEDMITFDMGGTTAKASIIEDGEILRAPEYEVGGGMSLGHRLLKGSGYILRVPAIDLAEVSAGAGRIAWVDKGGVLQCGPQSAGAVPGPVSYDAGGKDPTVTDANVVLGYLNPEYLLGGAFRLNAGEGAPCHRGGGRRPAGSWWHRGGPRRPHAGELQYGPRPAGGLDRARPRPPPLHAGRLRWRRSDSRGRPGRHAGYRQDRRSGIAGRLQRLRPPVRRRGAPLRPDPLQGVRRAGARPGERHPQRSA